MAFALQQRRTRQHRGVATGHRQALFIGAVAVERGIQRHGVVLALSGHQGLGQHHDFDKSQAQQPARQIPGKTQDFEFGQLQSLSNPLAARAAD